MKPATVTPLMGVHVALMVTMLLWAFNVTLLKWFIGYMDPVVSSGLRMVFAASALWVLMYWGVKQWSLLRGSRLWLIVLSALLMVYANQVLFASALRHTTASNASLVLALNPLLNGLLEALFFRKRLHLHYLLGAAIALIGVCLVIFNSANASWGTPALGDLMVVGSMLAFGLGVVVLQYLSHHSTERPNQLSLNSVIYGIGALALLIHLLLFGNDVLLELRQLSWQIWALLVFSGVVITALGAIAWGRGVASIGAGRAAIYMSWVPVLGVAFGALVLDEQLTVWHGYAMVAVLFGTGLCNLNPLWISKKLGRKKPF
jgi:drug/metabolite transporter (DMT)-like permease